MNLEVYSELYRRAFEMAEEREVTLLMTAKPEEGAYGN